MPVRQVLLAVAALVCAGGVTAAAIMDGAREQAEPAVVAAVPSAASQVSTASSSPRPPLPSLRPPSPTPAAITPAFRSSVLAVSAERLGSSHRPGCPVAVADLRLVEISYRDLAGGAR
ncbi:MAG: hypothetical protein M3486_03235, partial [Actinomycetota bacterium]|nr:hypothetical protein [Actinomycetota bacterium]